MQAFTTALVETFDAALRINRQCAEDDLASGSRGFEYCYKPILEYGGKHSLRPRDSALRPKRAVAADNRADPGQAPVTFDVAVVCLGVRFEGYCGNIARTIIFNPSPEHREMYRILLRCRAAALSAMVPGREVREVYKAAIQIVRTSRPIALPHFCRNAGYVHPYGKPISRQDCLAFAVDLCAQSRIPRLTRRNSLLAVKLFA